MRTHLNRRLIGVLATIVPSMLLYSAQACLASETLLSGFDGDLSSATGTDWTSDGLTTQAFVIGPGNGVTQGTQALEITQPKSPPQLVDMKLITLDNVALVAANDVLLMDVTVPEDVGARSVWFSFRGDGLFEDSPELFFDGELPPRSGTVVWNYAAAGLKDFAASYAGSYWTIAIGVRGNDYNGGLPITTVVDNVRFATIPEPASTMLALLGFGGLVALRRCKR